MAADRVENLSINLYWDHIKPTKIEPYIRLNDNELNELIIEY